MPWKSKDEAKSAGMMTQMDNAPLSLEQINKMVEMADAIMKSGKDKQTAMKMAVAQFKKMHRVENGAWVKTKESNSAPHNKYNIQESLALSEGQILPDQDGKRSYRAWWPLLKVGPGNRALKNYYSQAALESAAPLAVARKKMFFAHISGDVQPTERNVKDWAASIHETKIENGVLFGLVQAYDPWLKERMYDAPGELACSIEGRGKPSGTIDHEGEKYNLIESVKWINAFNIVDYPGNAPMGISLTEGDADKDDPQEETYMNIAELKEKNAELYAQLEKEIKEAAQAETKLKMDEKDAEIKRLKESQTVDQATIAGLKESQVKMENRLDAVEALGKKKDREARVAEEMKKLPAEAITEKFKILVESATDEKSALELIEERAKLFEGKVLGHGKSETPKSPEEALKERESLFMRALGVKIEEKKEDKK